MKGDEGGAGSTLPRPLTSRPQISLNDKQGAVQTAPPLILLPHVLREPPTQSPLRGQGARWVSPSPGPHDYQEIEPPSGPRACQSPTPLFPHLLMQLSLTTPSLQFPIHLMTD